MHIYEREVMNAIGVDIGTTNSCAIIGSDLASLEQVGSASANGIIPSYVSVGPNTVYCGEAARQRRTAHPDRTFYEFKRTIARKWRQRALWTSTAKHLTFKLGKPDNPDDPPVYGATLDNKFVQLTSFDLYVYLLKHMFKELPKNKPVVCVATVPATFTGPQREATKNAVAKALPAGSTVTTLNEPTAGAIAYTSRADSEVAPGDYLLVLDVGGGTTDATMVCTTKDGSIDVMRSKGDHDVGGAKLTDAVHTWVVAHCKKKGLKFAKDGTTLLHDRCEEAKRALSSVDEATIALSGVVVGDVEPLGLTRAKFDDLVHNEVSAMCEIATQATGPETSNVKHVVLVGGATRTLLLREHIQHIYTNANIATTLNPETAVARGAAMQALDLISQTTLPTTAAETPTAPKLRSEMLNATISMRVRADQSFVLVQQGTKLPHTYKRDFAPMNARQTRMLMMLTQGEHKLSSCNDVLAQYEIPKACTVTVVIRVGFDGSVRVKVKEKSSGRNLISARAR